MHTRGQSYIFIDYRHINYMHKSALVFLFCVFDILSKSPDLYASRRMYYGRVTIINIEKKRPPVFFFCIKTQDKHFYNDMIYGQMHFV